MLDAAGSPIREWTFSWKNLGDICEGRGHLGEEMPVFMYRLAEFALRSALGEMLNPDEVSRVIREAGVRAGAEFARNILRLDQDFQPFVAHLQTTLRDLKICLLQMEYYHPDTGEIVWVMRNDLTCSGMSIFLENMCAYDEGFLSGILRQYFDREYEAHEVNCWSMGDRFCRFHIFPKAS